MTKDEIPAFVDEIMATGCDITGVKGVGYVIGDADLPDEVYHIIEAELNRIVQKYGERDHLLGEITDYLVSIGRSYSPGSQLNPDISGYTHTLRK